MVAVAQTTPRLPNGEINRDAWFNRLSIRYPREKLLVLSNWFSLATPHGLEIANILLELHADLDAILAALLIDHTAHLDAPQFKALPVSIIKLLKNGAELHQVGEKLFVQKQSSKIEGVRQMMLAMIKEVRVVLVKLAERTYAARNLKTLSPAAQQKLALELAELYAPLANRLGIGILKWELEDRAFAVLQPDTYKQLSATIHTRRQEREIFIQSFVETLSDLLETAEIRAEVSGRVKHLYGIWRKMQQKSLKFDALYDVRAVRILVRDVPTCYTVMALLHAQWTPLVSEYTDYIINPKPNGYRSLHTVLVGEDHLPIEVQIRTFGMHEQAESGVAAHWRYKENSAENISQDRVQWLRTLLEWQTEVSSGQIPAKLDKMIYVFTKDNEVFALTRGATPVDFAFLVHTEIGLKTKGALVNGRMVALTHVLETGDQVEILTHKTANPSHDWLIASQGYLATSHAKRKLRAYFRSIEDPESKPVAISTESAPLPFKRKRSLDATPAVISLAGLENFPFEYARCCKPTVGMPIIASLTRARGVVIHSQACKNAAYFLAKRPDRLCKATWVKP